MMTVETSFSRGEIEALMYGRRLGVDEARENILTVNPFWIPSPTFHMSYTDTLAETHNGRNNVDSSSGRNKTLRRWSVCARALEEVIHKTIEDEHRHRAMQFTTGSFRVAGRNTWVIANEITGNVIATIRELSDGRVGVRYRKNSHYRPVFEGLPRDKFAVVPGRNFSRRSDAIYIERTDRHILATRELAWKERRMHESRRSN